MPGIQNGSVGNTALLYFRIYFWIERDYGRIDDLLANIKEWGIQEVHFIDTSKSAFIPMTLRPPFMVGTIGIIYGVKLRLDSKNICERYLKPCKST